MNFLIVAPRFVNKVGQYYNFPLGLAYISSSLIFNNMLWDTEVHSETETFLYTPLAPGILNNNNRETLQIHYFAYYFNYWLPLLEQYFANHNNIFEEESMVPLASLN